MYGSIVKRLIRKIHRLGDKAIYGGTKPFDDLKHLTVTTKQGAKICCYKTPDGYLECAFTKVKPWSVYEELQSIFFELYYIDNGPVKKFRGGNADEIIRRVIQGLV